jgi:hypothetical protein
VTVVVGLVCFLAGIVVGVVGIVLVLFVIQGGLRGGS